MMLENFRRKFTKGIVVIHCFFHHGRRYGSKERIYEALFAVGGGHGNELGNEADLGEGFTGFSELKTDCLSVEFNVESVVY
jgi:hypothetical protein